MKKEIIIIVLVMCSVVSFSQQKERIISVIPEPVSVVKKGGHYVLPNDILISLPSNIETAYIKSLIEEKLSIAAAKKSCF